MSVTANPPVPARDDGPPEGLDQRRLVRGGLRLGAIIAVVIAVIVFLPGLSGVRARFDGLGTGWVVAAIVAELLSCVSYVLIFRAVFARQISWVRGGRLALAELAVVALLPVGGIGGLALGAWVMRRHGVPGETVARRSVAFFLLTSAVNFAAVVLIGGAMGIGLLPAGGERFLSLVLAASALVAVVLIPILLVFVGRYEADSKAGSLARSLGAGVSESRQILRHGGFMAWSGAIGYWAFDTAALYFSLRAVGSAIPVGSTAMGHLIGMLGSLIPVPGGIGGVDGGLVGSLIAYGAGASAAVAAVLAFRAVNTVVRLAVGAPALAIVLSREAAASATAAAVEAVPAEAEVPAGIGPDEPDPDEDAEHVLGTRQACRSAAMLACEEAA